MRAELARLLQVLRDPAQTFLERSALGALDVSTQLRAAAAHEYRLLQTIGQGGMGFVYLAERVSGDVCDRVAIKLLNPALLGDAPLLARFSAERQILGRLEHPNIARMLDAGTLADGQPFLAMEYVQGQTIDRYCSEHAVPLGERLQLFLRVCAAVEYAHQRLIIHRDIKPGNILVTAEGTPKLLDFGIARLLDRDDATQTAANARLMTLAYASPEQITGAPLGVATDIYSLGVLLYELISGRSPWGAASPTQLIVHTISNDPVAPSIAAYADDNQSSQRGFSRRRTAISADLDAIVLKAMRKEPAARYANVATFAEDVQALLANRPVKARQGRSLYRARKFATRHRYALLSAALVLVLLIGTVVERERQLRLTAQARVQEGQVSDLMITTLGSIDPDNAAKRSQKTDNVLSNLTQRLLDSAWTDPAREVRLLTTVGTLQWKWGHFADAQAILTKAWAIAEAQPGLVDAQTRATVVHDLGAVTLDDAQATERWFRRSLQISREEIGPNSSAAINAELNLAGLLLGKSVGRENEIREYSEGALRALAATGHEPTEGEAILKFNAARNLWNLDGDAQRFLDIIAEVQHRLEMEHSGFSRVANVLLSRTDVLAATGRYASALRDASAVAQRSRIELGADHFLTVSAELEMLYFAILAGDWPFVVGQAHPEQKVVEENPVVDDVQQIWADYYVVRGLSRLPGELGRARERASNASRLERETKNNLTAADHALVASSEALVAYIAGDLPKAAVAIARARAAVEPLTRRTDQDTIQTDVLLLAAEIALAQGRTVDAVSLAQRAKQLRPVTAAYADALLAQAESSGPPSSSTLALFTRALVDDIVEPDQRCTESQLVASRLPLARSRALPAAAQAALLRCAEAMSQQRLGEKNIDVSGSP